MTDFRTVAVALAPYVSGADLIGATDAVLAAITEPPPVGSPDRHDWLVQKALANPDVMYNVALNKRINAIKGLRDESGCSLKEAKEAIEDSRIMPA